MWISRVRVTGGFLAGLDLTFTQGLNVIIGPRGAGKTTLLELLRHAVGAIHADDRSSKERQTFLSKVLGTGEVIVDVEGDGEGRHIVVDAAGAGQRAELGNHFLVLGQNELESIASNAESRRNLIDMRVGREFDTPDRGPAGELTARMFDLRSSMELLAEETQKRSVLETDQGVLLSQEAAMLQGSSQLLTEVREQLRGIEDQIVQSAVTLDRVQTARSALAQVDKLAGDQIVVVDVVVERLSDVSLSGELQSGAATLQAAVSSVSEATSSLGALLRSDEEGIRQRDTLLREQAAPLRIQLEEAEAGLGQVTSQLRNIQSELRTLDEHDLAIASQRQTYEELRSQRSVLFQKIEMAEEELYATRAAIAKTTTAEISNNVVVVVDHLASTEGFRSELQSLLQGSSIRMPVVDAIASRVLPRQLLDLVETRDRDGLVAAAGINPDQADRVVDYLSKSASLVRLSQATLLDRVDFRLRDGLVDKSVDALSTGQKCAVTLPILLSEKARALILDQPEDHLDNAYLVGHVVTGMISRSAEGAQTIVATHNANIPVLGSASEVAVLTSDGANGSVSTAGPYDRDDIVLAITSLMEGGRVAFEQRAAFYADHGALSGA